MSRLLLAGMIVLWIGAPSIAQTEFAPIGASWIYLDGFEDYYGYSFSNRRLHIVEKDTVYKGVECRKVKIYDFGFSAPSTVYNEHIRNEYFYTHGDSVFKYSELFERFVLHLRFDVEAGDTLYYPLPSIPHPELVQEDSSFCVIVDSVKMITLNNGEEVRRVFNHVWLRDGDSLWGAYNYFGFHPWHVTLSENGVGFYTERLGTIEYRINELLSAVVTAEMYYDLICYRENDILYSSSYWQQPCSTEPNLSTGDLEINGDIAIYPNPASDLLNIHIRSLNELGHTQIYITDITGKNVMNVHHGEINNYLDWYQAIDISILSAQTYLLHILTESGNAHRLISKL